MARKTKAAGAAASDKPASEVQKWLGHITAYDKEFESWCRRVEKILKRYRDKRSEMSDNTTQSDTRFNILWSNVQTLVPATFARVPQPDVSRRYNDTDQVGRVAALILERALEFEVQHYPDYHATMKQSVQDRFLGGRGTAWARYEPHMKAAEKQVPTEGEQISEDVDTPDEELDYECAPTDYVHWRDFGHVVARTWEEVPAVWRRVFLDREALVARFGEKGEKIPLDAKPSDMKRSDSNTAAGSGDDDHNARAAIYEIWDKAKREALWLSRSQKEIIDRKSVSKDDPTSPPAFDEFFPCPRPLYATLTNDSLVPVPDFTLYQDQARELDLCADRIDGLVKALQVKGVYDGSVPEIGRLFTEGVNNTLIPVKSWQAFAEKNGLQGAISLVDLAPIAKALEQTYMAMEQIKRQVYEITGISDIIRGNTDAGETATAQRIKGQYATLRLRAMQTEVAQYATDLLRLKAQIIVTFDAQTLMMMAAVQQLTPEDQQLVPQALELLKSDPMRNFRIEIAADSLVQIDEKELKESRVEMLTGVGVFLDKAGPIAASAPPLIPVIIELLKFGLTAFKAGRQIEGTIDAALDQMKAQAAQGTPPDPAQMQEQAMQQAKAQVAQENATKEIGLNKRGADLDIRELKFAAEQEIAKQREDGQLEREKMDKEDKTRRYEVDKRVEVDREKVGADKEIAGDKIRAAEQPALELGGLNDGMQKLGEALAQMGEMMGQVNEMQAQIAQLLKQQAQIAAAPKEVRRGKDGRATHLVPVLPQAETVQ